MKKLYLRIKSLYSKVSEKRYTTLAGTLVFFLLLSIVPFAFLSTLLLNGVNVDLSAIEQFVLIDKFSEIITMVKGLAINASKSANIIFFFTAVYSSTNFFFHLRRSGEIIFDVKSRKRGIIVRISAILWVFVFMLGLVIISAAFVTAQYLMSEFTGNLIKLAVYGIFAVYVYFVATFFSVYAKPFKVKFLSALKGGLYVFIFWIIASSGFAVYLKFFANIERLYGALAFVIAFLLWLYLLMQGLVLGVILSGNKGALTKNFEKYAT